MRRLKNGYKVIFLLIITLAVSVLLMSLSILDIDRILCLGNEFQYNAISLSAIIGGFLFTGISILLSLIDREGIKRLWENHYLDNIYNSAVVGLVANIVTIILAFMIICCQFAFSFQSILIGTEIVALATGLVFFSWCVKQLSYVLSKLKKKLH